MLIDDPGSFVNQTYEVIHAPMTRKLGDIRACKVYRILAWLLQYTRCRFQILLSSTERRYPTHVLIVIHASHNLDQNGKKVISKFPNYKFARMAKKVRIKQTLYHPTLSISLKLGPECK